MVKAVYFVALIGVTYGRANNATGPIANRLAINLNEVLTEWTRSSTTTRRKAWDLDDAPLSEPDSSMYEWARPDGKDNTSSQDPGDWFVPAIYTEDEDAQKNDDTKILDEQDLQNISDRSDSDGIPDGPDSVAVQGAVPAAHSGPNSDAVDVAVVPQECLFLFQNETTRNDSGVYTHTTTTETTQEQYTGKHFGHYNDTEHPPHIDGMFPKFGDIPLLNRKIIGAHAASVSEHPYVVSVRRNYSHYLTGTLVSRNLVLSVARALHNVPVYELGVVLGESCSDRGRAVVLVLFTLVHSGFVAAAATQRHDLAALVLRDHDM